MPYGNKLKKNKQNKNTKKRYCQMGNWGFL